MKEMKIPNEICDKLWDAVNITNEDKKMAQFGATLQAKALTWFMTDNWKCSKE